MTDVHVQVAAKIHLADTAPAACSCCGQRDLEGLHVDFGAAWDGPMIPAPEGVAGGKLVSIDDLVLCAECVAEGARLLGLDDVTALAAKAEGLAGECEDKAAQLAAVTAQLDRLRAAHDAGGELARLLADAKPSSRKRKGVTLATEPHHRTTKREG